MALTTTSYEILSYFSNGDLGTEKERYLAEERYLEYRNRINEKLRRSGQGEISSANLELILKEFFRSIK